MRGFLVCVSVLVGFVTSLPAAGRRGPPVTQEELYC